METLVAFREQLACYGGAADDAERDHHREIMRLLELPDAFSRSHFAPGHITASLFIVDPAGRLLLHYHRRLCRWLQMGGHLEDEESPLEAALREGAEESGLHDLEPMSGEPFDLDIHPIPAGKGEPDHRHFDVRYIARTNEPERITIDAAESVDLRWSTLEQAAEMMSSPESRRAIAKIAKLVWRS
ncbi:MAG TPA: NUDIX hydrolase [Thermoanaerobaculia bacterium]